MSCHVDASHGTHPRNHTMHKRLQDFDGKRGSAAAAAVGWEPGRGETPLGVTVCDTVPNVGDEIEQAKREWDTALSYGPSSSCRGRKYSIKTYQHMDCHPCCSRRQARS